MPAPRYLTLLTIVAACGVASVSAQPKPAEKKDAPRVKIASPLGVVAGQTTVITIRGLNLDTATEIRFPDVKLPIEASIKKKEKAPAPQKQDPQVVGDTQLEVESKIPADLPPGVVSFIVATPAGESAPHKLVVLDPRQTVAEKEPNDGFSQAQEIHRGETVVGAVHQPQNADVFKITGKAGEKISIEVHAARYGSALDPLLTFLNERGEILTVADDRQEDTDAVIEATLPADGTYFIALIDAHDQGGPAHPFLLLLR